MAGALEDACGVTVGEQLRALRRLIYCGEWIASHVLHIFLLHAPTFWATRTSCRWRKTTQKYSAPYR